MKQILTC